METAVVADKAVVYEPIDHTQFDHVIEYLKGEKLVAGGCTIKGENGGYPKGSDGWLATVFHLGGRNMESICWPWLIVTANAVFWTVLVESTDINPYDANGIARNWNTVYSYGLSATLSLLLAFRLNRSILRYWEGMMAWGTITINIRSLVSSILIHGRDIPHHRDQIVGWTAAMAIAAKKEIREYEITCDDLRGILTDEQCYALDAAPMSSLYAANEIRYHLKPLFDVRPDYNHSALSPARSGEMRQHERYLDAIIANIGKVHNLKQTPLPLVYVAHLRTFLIIYLLSLPYTLFKLWSWGTIPIVAVTAWLMLGIEAASMEVESPFEKGHVNDLDLDNYCLTIMLDIKQLVADFQKSS